MKKRKTEHEEREKGDDKDAERLSSFHSYDLVAMGIPTEARPLKDKKYYGKLSYTLCSPNGAASWNKME